MSRDIYNARQWYQSQSYDPGLYTVLLVPTQASDILVPNIIGPITCHLVVIFSTDPHHASSGFGP